jgi:hypothetical protein
MLDVKFNDEDFKKSSLSGTTPRPGGPRCVAVAVKDGVYAVRDTKDASKTTLRFTKDEWEAFIGGVKLGEFE